MLLKEFDQLVFGHAALLTSIAVAESDGSIFFDGVEVDRNTEGCTDLVLAAVAATNGSRGVIEDVPAALQFFVKLRGDLD